MIIAALCFYLFSAVTIAAGFMVVAARNPVHSVLFLILAFLSAAGLFVLMGAEFLAMILVVVYVGAVAVLFMFVVMMLDIDVAALRQGFMHYLPAGSLIGVVLLIEIGFIVATWQTGGLSQPLASPMPPIDQVHNTEALGNLLYTKYFYLFQVAGLILLVAMIGAIVLTLRQRVGVRKQKVAAQVGRTRAESVELKDVAPGSGVG